MTTINIYYGGRGLIDDPSIYVMDKLTTVFDELNVNVKRYNLCLLYTSDAADE